MILGYFALTLTSRAHPERDFNHLIHFASCVTEKKAIKSQRGEKSNLTKCFFCDFVRASSVRKTNFSSRNFPRGFSFANPTLEEADRSAAGW
jgi:hypothetical protein